MTLKASHFEGGVGNQWWLNWLNHLTYWMKKKCCCLLDCTHTLQLDWSVPGCSLGSNAHVLTYLNSSADHRERIIISSPMPWSRAIGQPRTDQTNLGNWTAISFKSAIVGPQTIFWGDRRGPLNKILYVFFMISPFLLKLILFRWVVRTL